MPQKNCNEVVVRSLLLIFVLGVIAGATGCSRPYLHFWEDEMFLYRPSAVERAGLRTALKESEQLCINLKEGSKTTIPFYLPVESVGSEDEKVAKADDKFIGNDISIEAIGSGETRIIVSVQTGGFTYIKVNVHAANSGSKKCSPRDDSKKISTPGA